MQRRSFLSLGGASLALAAGSTFPILAKAQNSTKTIRIGYQKSSTLITILKTNGTLEKLLASSGAKITWNEFSSGLPLLEALNVGAIDVSADVADTVPIFAQAAGARLTYYAQEAPSPSAQAILVRPDSPIKTVADLKGKKVAVTKAAGVHYLLIALLEKNGLKFSDVDIAYLQPPEGRAAFERGSIDAWVTYDPFFAGAQRQTQVRVLADGKGGVAGYQRYYLAASSFADANPNVIALIFNELKKTGAWVRQYPKEAAALLAPVWGLDTQTIELANSRRSYEVRAVAATELFEQQRIADAFFASGLLPKKISASDLPIWAPSK